MPLGGLCLQLHKRSSMIFTEAFVVEKFREFNKTIFYNTLPEPTFQLSRARSFLGKCVTRRLRGLEALKKKSHIECTLRFSTSFDLPENELEDIIIHEMIHYRIAYNCMRDTSSHGQMFKSMMQEINREHGRNIAIRHRMSESNGSQLTDAPKRLSRHVVAVVKFKDGRTGIKVLPRIVQRISNYYNKVGAASHVESVDLYFSLDPYFNLYPNSSALKVHIIAPDVLEEHLKNAHKMYCEGEKVGLV